MSDETVRPARTPEIGDCDCCEYGPVEVLAYPRHTRAPSQEEGNRTWRLCRLCSSTLTGSLVGYGRPEGAVLQTIAYVGNAILATIRSPV